MPSYIVAEKTEYELPPAGLHPAVCVDYVDEGYKPTQYGDKHKVRYVFQLEAKNSKGFRHTVSAWFNYSMHENSTLRQFLEQWRGRPFSEAEINQPPGFDLESVIGIPCNLNIIHNKKGEKTYANIASIMQHSPRMGEPLKSEGYTRVQDRQEQQAQVATAAAGGGAIADEEVPF